MISKEEIFWNWFKDKNQEYLNLNDMDKVGKENLLNLLENKLHEYCKKLFFEIGGMLDLEQELIITAEGNIDYFEYVEQLIDCAPKINKWTFTAFIQPQGCGNIISYEDVELKPINMWFMPLQSKSKPQSVAIKICTPNYEQVKGSEWFEDAMFKTLDTVLGEKSFALDVDYIDYGELPSDPDKKGMIAMTELCAYIKWKKSKV